MKQKPFKLPFASERDVVAAINRLPLSHRGIIGRVIWWDFYAGRMVVNRSARFDGWLNEPLADKEPAGAELSLSLQKMGYDKDTSDKRFSDKYKPTPPRKK